MTDYVLYDIDAWNLRPPMAPIERLPLPGTFSIRAGPEPPQFSGNVGLGPSSLPGSRIVQLRVRSTGVVVEETRSDPTTGYFRFKAWYPKNIDYEFVVLGGNYRSIVYPVAQPDEVQWNGNPAVHPSTP